MRITPENITELKPNEIFVFGSNLAGRHGKGAALTATQWGAIRGQGEGLMGQTYGLPTKDENLNILNIYKIKKHVDILINTIKDRKDLIFLVTSIGTGLAGYPIPLMAQLFKPLLQYENVYLPKVFLDFYKIDNKDEFWNNLKKMENIYDIPPIPKCTKEEMENYYAPKLIKAGAIPLTDLEDNEHYIGKCRNAKIARWDAKIGKFIYKRTKFNYTFDEEINHFEDDDGFDVFVPIKKVGQI